MKLFLTLLIFINFSLFSQDYVYQGQSEIKPIFNSKTNKSFEGLSGGFYRYFRDINSLYSTYSEFDSLEYNRISHANFANFEILDNDIVKYNVPSWTSGDAGFNGHGLKGLNIQSIDIIENPHNIPVFLDNGNLYFNLNDNINSVGSTTIKVKISK